MMSATRTRRYEIITDYNITTDQLNIKVSYKNKIYELPITYTLSFYRLVSMLKAKLKVDSFRNFTFEYKSKTIDQNSTIQMVDIISDDDDPIISINPKKNQDYSNTYVLLENYPSPSEIKELLVKFCEDKMEESQPKIIFNNANNNCKVFFHKSELCFDFISHMTMLKYSNSLYQKIKINLKYKFINPRNNNLSLDNSINSDNNSRKNLFVTRRVYSNSELDTYFKDQMYVRGGSPYLTEEQRYLKERMEKKKKWINKKGFLCSIGNYSTMRKTKNTELGKELILPPINITNRNGLK